MDAHHREGGIEVPVSSVALGSRTHRITKLLGEMS
jgi:hypothetical protein